MGKDEKKKKHYFSVMCMSKIGNLAVECKLMLDVLIVVRDEYGLYFRNLTDLATYSCLSG